MDMVKRLYADSADVIRDISGAVLCGEDVMIQVGRLGFTLRYVNRENAEWRSFSPAQTDRPEFLLAQDGAVCFAAFRDDRFVGLLSMRINAGWAEIVDLRVDASCRRQGVATALITECDRYADRHRLAGLRMAATDDNPVLCRFLQSRGFSPEGIDKLLSSGNPTQRNKPRMLRTVTLYFYRPFSAGI